MLSALSPTVRKDILTLSEKDRTGERHHRLRMFRKYRTFQRRKHSSSDGTRSDHRCCLCGGYEGGCRCLHLCRNSVYFCRIRIRFSHSLCSQNHAFSRITGISLLKKYRSTVRSDTFLLVLIIQTCTLCHKRTHICIRYFDMLRMCRIRFDIFRFFKRCHKRHIMRA